jgi:nucleoside-diphosphate-sugar epimerase
MSDNATRRIYNVAEQPSYSELEWAARVGAAAGWKGAFVVLPADAMPPHLRMSGNFEQHWSVDSSRIRSELGYVEPVGVDSAIAQTIAWERDNPPSRPLAAIDYVAEDAAIAPLASRTEGSTA